MENRYENIELLRTELGKRFKKTIRYPKMAKESQDMYIISIQGDRLDNLAFKYYEDARLWWILARANNLGKGDKATFNTTCKTCGKQYPGYDTNSQFCKVCRVVDKGKR